MTPLTSKDVAQAVCMGEFERIAVRKFFEDDHVIGCNVEVWLNGDNLKEPGRKIGFWWCGVPVAAALYAASHGSREPWVLDHLKNMYDKDAWRPETDNPETTGLTNDHFANWHEGDYESHSWHHTYPWEGAT